MTSSERILKAAEANGGTITTEQVNKMEIHRTILRNMVDKGLLDHSARGVYVLPSKLDDEIYNLQTRFKKGQTVRRCIYWDLQTKHRLSLI